jgi:hypothetical protein
VVVPATTDEQVALLASFETTHREEGTRQFMAAERGALAAMLVVRASVVKKTARVAEAARAAAQAEELTEEAAAAQEEMARDRCRWDDDMGAARRARKVHELATQHRHRRNLASRHGIRARQADGEGSNVVDPGWGDNLL